MTTNCTLRIPVSGDLISSTSDDFRKRVTETMTSGARFDTIEVDLTRARKIDSAGLNALVGLIRASNQLPISVKVSDPNVQRILLFARLNKFLRIDSSATKA